VQPKKRKKLETAKRSADLCNSTNVDTDECKLTDHHRVSKRVLPLAGAAVEQANMRVAAHFEKSLLRRIALNEQPR
jgi:hypothetical protein